MTDETGLTREAAKDPSPARLFLVVSAVYHFALGVLGLAVNRSFPFTPDATLRAGSDHILGVFETNGWHSLAAVLIGAVSLYFVLRPHRAAEGALAVGLSQLAVVVSLAVWDPSVFLLASNGADQWIHSLTAVGGIATGLVTLAGRRTLTSDQRRLPGAA